MDTHEFREVGHRMVDLLSEYLEHIEERPLFADVEPAKLNKLFAEPLPQNPSSSDEVLQQIQEKLLPYCTAANRPAMSAICIRYRGDDMDESESKQLHAEVASRVERNGRFWISTTEMKGRTWFRINPVNFRTRP